jgi:hypothetical protein
MLADREPPNVDLALVIIAATIVIDGLRRLFKLKRRPLSGSRPPAEPPHR